MYPTNFSSLVSAGIKPSILPPAAVTTTQHSLKVSAFFLALFVISRLVVWIL